MKYIIISLLLSVCAHAGFTQSGTTITQTGTDDEVSLITALQGMAGVTATSYGTGANEFTVYVFTAKLNVTGELDLDLSRAMIVFSMASQPEILNVANTGNLNVESLNTRLGYTTNFPQGQIVFALTSNSGWANREFNLIGSGRMTLKNIALKGVFSPWLAPDASGSVLLEDVVIDKDGSVGDIQTNVHGHKENVTFRRVKIYADGQSGVTFRDNVGGNGTSAVMEDVEIYQARDAWNNESTDRLVVRGLTPNLGSSVDVAQFGNKDTKVINAVRGTEFLWGGHLANSNGNTGTVEVYQSLGVTTLDAEGAPIEEESPGSLK